MRREEDLSMSVLPHKQQRLEGETVFPHHLKEEVSIGSTCLIGRTFSFYYSIFKLSVRSNSKACEFRFCVFV